MAKGNLGRSYRDGRPVLDLIKERLPATLSLIAAALSMALAIGLGWGVALTWLSTTKYFAVLEKFLLALAYGLYSTPSFWLGFLLIGLLAQSGLSDIHLLGLHPPGAKGICLASLILPALVLASRRAAKVALILNSSMLAELKSDYVFTARAKGVPPQTVLLKHVGKNSLAPVVSLLGLSIPALIGGSVLVETVFAWPGMGRLAVDATFGRNYPVLLSLTIIYGSLVILGNLLADIIQAMIDPRLKETLEEKRPRRALLHT
jgi:peptide/nickel transport system permease protein